MPDPEAPTGQVQAPADIRTEAIAEARQIVESRSDPPPEAAPVVGTGTEGAETPAADTPVEVDWTNAEARETHLKEKYVSVEEHEKRKKDQLRSLQDKITLGEQAEIQRRRESLLSELDELSERDPDAYIARINKNPHEAQALVERASQISPVVMQQASVSVATGLAKSLFAVRPELEALAESGDESWAAVVNQETGGPFGYIQRTAFDEGQKAGVDSFKQSKEFKDAIAEAERRGAHGAIGTYEVSTPSADDAQPVAAGARRKFDNPVQEAAYEASVALKRNGLDYSKLGTRRR